MSTVNEQIAEKFNTIITLEENAVIGGFGSRILLHFQSKNRHFHKFLNIGLSDNFITHGDRDQLIELVGLSPAAIKNKILQFLKIPVHNKYENLEYISHE
jgi:1-deoxy-D-xylulose-5-phosphate synthase